MEHQAIAEDGPLAGDPNLPAYDHDSDGRWPSPVVWPTGTGERHVYVLNGIALTPTGAPRYRFGRTLDADEPDPPEGRATPPS